MAFQHRFLFALRPPAWVCAAIGRIRDSIADLTALVADPRIHATLAITEDFPSFPSGLVQPLRRIGETTAAEPFTATFDQLNRSPHSAALRPQHRIAGFQSLAAALDGPLARLGVRRRDWTCNAHVTLGYGRGVSGSRAIAPVGWNATDFVLIHSVVGETRHIELGRWPLVRRQGELFD